MYAMVLAMAPNTGHESKSTNFPNKANAQINFLLQNKITMHKLNAKLVIAKTDYEVIMLNLKSSPGKTMFSRQDAAELEAELRKATLVGNEDFPGDVVRLNSQVTIKDERANKIMKLMVVMPENADIKQKKISIMSPVGTALLGYKKGKKVSWQVPSGKKTFTILDVRSPMS